jgi:hypothetical protein
MRTEGQDDFNKWVLNTVDGNMQHISGLTNGTVEIPHQLTEETCIIKGMYLDQLFIDIINEELLPTNIIVTIINKDPSKINNDILNN